MYFSDRKKQAYYKTGMDYLKTKISFHLTSTPLHFGAASFYTLTFWLEKSKFYMNGITHTGYDNTLNLSIRLKAQS